MEVGIMIVPQLLFTEDTVMGNRLNPIKEGNIEVGSITEIPNGSSPYMGATIPEWWNGIHSGLRNRVERRVGSSPTLGTYCPLV